jgi:molybdate transport system substrate-binding protein
LSPVSRLSSIVLFLLACGCSRPAPPHGPAPILVAAASNLSVSFAEVARAFTAKTGIPVTFSFAATGDLAEQIVNGAPYDLFAAADVRHAEELRNRGLLIPETCARYARGRLVLWKPRGDPLREVQDIARMSRIAIANPQIAPYGQAAVESLGALGIWREVEPKVVYGNNVSQTQQYAATGNVDAAFLPLALLTNAQGHYLEVDERLHRPIDQALGVVKASRNQDSARRFAAFILGPEGQAILKRYGYGPAR